MALWLVRAGSAGEYENKFLDESRIYLTWDQLRTDLSAFADPAALTTHMAGFYSASINTVRNWTGQVWAFSHRIQKGDWVVLPSKLTGTIHIAEVTGDYQFDPKGENPYYHWRSVRWIEKGIPRSNFDQDLLYSFGAFMTVCRIQRNDAEARVMAMAKNGWQVKTSVGVPAKGGANAAGSDEDDQAPETDLEQFAKDQIMKHVARKYTGHGLARLIEAILRAKGYTTHRSEPGPDKGVDILAGLDPMGFGAPRLCVQVKSGDTPVDRPTLDQLVGTMQNVGAEYGVLVSWAGFKNTVEKEVPAKFFRVRLWRQQDIINELLSNYERLDEDLKAEFPLKRIWAMSLTEESGS